MEDTLAMILISVAVGFLSVILTVLLMLFRLIGETETNLKADMNAKHAELRRGQADIRRRLRNLELDVGVLKSHAVGLGPFMAERDARTRSAGEAAPEQAAATEQPTAWTEGPEPAAPARSPESSAPKVATTGSAESPEPGLVL